MVTQLERLVLSVTAALGKLDDFLSRSPWMQMGAWEKEQAEVIRTLAERVTRRLKGEAKGNE